MDSKEATIKVELSHGEAIRVPARPPRFSVERMWIARRLLRFVNILLRLEGWIVPWERQCRGIKQEDDVNS